jgi:hypothetical protein
MGKKLGAREKLLDKAIVDRLLAAIRVGATHEEAAHCAGIHPSTMYVWLSKARQPRAPKLYTDFAEKFKRAESNGMVTVAERVFRASSDDWRAGAHWLACRSIRWVSREKAADEERFLSRILALAKESLSDEAYEELLSAVAEDHDFS